MAKNKNEFIETDRCRDIGGEFLKIGDRVVPCFVGIEGTISKIFHNEEKNISYIKVVDDNGKSFVVYSKEYTTKERFIESEINNNYIYTLTAFNREGHLVVSDFILNANRDAEFEFPEDTYYIRINASHLVKKGENSESYSSPTIFYLVPNSVECIDYDEEIFYLRDSETYCSIDWVYKGHYKIFNSKKELENYAREIIAYFKTADLADITNNGPFQENEKAKNFEKQLIYKLKH